MVGGVRGAGYECVERVVGNVMFTENWFDVTAKGNFEKYVSGLSGEFLEIGCFEGRATCWMLNHTKANVTVIDTFIGSPAMWGTGVNLGSIKQRFIENTRSFKNRVTALEGWSRNVLKALDKNFDFIYVDGSHYAAAALRDIVYSWELLKVGGLMIMDDYTWGDPGAQVARMAIEAFMACYKGEYELLTKNAQCVIRKLQVTV